MRYILFILKFLLVIYSIAFYYGNLISFLFENVIPIFMFQKIQRVEGHVMRLFSFCSIIINI